MQISKISQKKTIEHAQNDVITTQQSFKIFKNSKIESFTD